MAGIENPGGRAGHSLNEVGRSEKKRRKRARRKMRRIEGPEEIPSVPKSVNEKIIVDLLPAGPRVTIIPLGGSQFDSERRE